MFQNYKIAFLREHIKVKEERPLNFLRQSIAYVLSQSARQIPHAGMVTHYDVTPLMEYAKATERNFSKKEGISSKEALLQRAIRKNYSAFFLKAIAHSFYHTPVLNAFLDYTPRRFKCGTIYLAEDINLSFTIHTKYGVIKPIARNPHQKNIATVANEMRDLTRRARKTDANVLYRKAAITYLKSSLKQCDIKELSGVWMLLRSFIFERVRPDPEFKDVPQDQQLQVSDMLGATCTLANIGSAVEGHQTLTVITPPEVAMFGLSDIHLAPTVVDGQVVARHTVTLFSTIDHRAYDAGEVFPFINHLKRYINEPARIYEWKPGDEI